MSPTGCADVDRRPVVMGTPAATRSLRLFWKKDRRTFMAKRKWSAAVTKRSNALDLESGVFKHANPKQIAASLKRSAERSTRRKGAAFQSAMSMLSFYINRAGKNLPASRRKVLDRAKAELRALYGK